MSNIVTDRQFNLLVNHLYAPFKEKVTVSDALDWVREEKRVICAVDVDYFDGWYYTGKYLDKSKIDFQYTNSFDDHYNTENELLTTVLNYLKEKENKEINLMSKEEKAKERWRIKDIESFWYRRNPSHDYNADTGEDMFFGTVRTLFEEYAEIENKALSTQLSACKEALREIIKECEEWVVPGAENSNNCENNHCVEVDDLKSLITKAKTIIE